MVTSDDGAAAFSEAADKIAPKGGRPPLGEGEGSQTPGAKRARRLRAERRAAREGGAASPPLAPAPVSEEEIAIYGTAGGVAWRLMGSAGLPVRALTMEEERELGRALAPVARKWLPKLAGWEAELGLALAVLHLAHATYTPKGGATESNPRDLRAEGNGQELSN